MAYCLKHAFFFTTHFFATAIKGGSRSLCQLLSTAVARLRTGRQAAWAQEPPASEHLQGARAELAAGQQHQVPTGRGAPGKWQRAHAAPQRR